MPTITRRLLPPDEWWKVIEPFQRCFPGRELPPAEAVVLWAVEEHDGEIVGFIPLLQIIHAEPFGSLANASIHGLHQTVHEALLDKGLTLPYHVTVPRDSTQGHRNALELGMKPLGVLYAGVLGGADKESEEN